MSESEHPADKILGADWHPPLQALGAKAWARTLPEDRARGIVSEHDTQPGAGDWIEQDGSSVSCYGRTRPAGRVEIFLEES